MSDVFIDRIRTLAPRRGQIWQGGLVRMPAWIRDAGRTPYRPVLGLWVSLQDSVARTSRVVPPEEVGHHLALEALANLACDGTIAGYLPARLEVNDPDLAESLARTLAGLGVEVVHREHLLMIEQFLKRASAAVGIADVPGALSPPGVTLDRFRAFADAAAEFHRAAPWRHLQDIDLLRIETPVPDPALRFASVLGQGGVERGVWLFETSDILWETQRRGGDPGTGLARHGAWLVTYDPIDRIPASDADLWLDHDLPVAGEGSIPVATFVKLGTRIRRPSVPVLTFLEGLLRALAASSEAEIDGARWSRRVETFDGPLTIGLALPDLESPPDPATLLRRGFEPDRRGMERGMWLIGRELDRHPGATREEVTRIVAAFSGKSDREIEFKPESPLEAAQDLCYQAFDALGRRAVLLARQAVETCPDCADAHVILAEHCVDPLQRRERYESGVAAGERSLGPATFTEEAGHFWEVVRTRPYMRARFGLAATLERLGDVDGAIGHYNDMLRLNTGDNLRLRDHLLPLLFVRGRDADAAALLDRFEEDDSAPWRYGRALLAYRSGAEPDGIRAVLDRAVEANPDIALELLGEEPPAGRPTPHGKVAEYFGPLLRPAWEATPGASAWLRERMGLEAHAGASTD
jgi:tetratricopeptide (TPR) repeat protein